MSRPGIRALEAGFTAEPDVVDAAGWTRIVEEFDDANIYQTWAFTAATSNPRTMSHLLLKKDGEVVAAAQVRVVNVPILRAGIAYVRWGPLWRRTGVKADVNIFRQAIRALRNEFSCRRGLVLRLFPMAHDDNSESIYAILTDEGFAAKQEQTRSRTILMDITSPADLLRQGMAPHWQRELKLAERKNLKIISGSDDQLFGQFLDIYREMVARKNFREGTNIDEFRQMQAQLPEKQKMRIMLAVSDAGLCSGVIYSAMGKTAVYLYGATSKIGMKSNGSYLLHWNLIQSLRKDGYEIYDLNGINPETNPGTYKFKLDLAGKHGRDIYFLGRFDSCASLLSQLCVKCGEILKSLYQVSKQSPAGARTAGLRPKAAN